MAQCITCKTKTGFFSTRSVGVVSPLCATCADALITNITEFYNFFVENFNLSASDGKAAARTAAATLLMAERVNLKVTIVRPLGQTVVYYTWTGCRDSAIKFAQLGQKLVADDSQGRAFLDAVLNRAEQLSASHAEETSRVKSVPLTKAYPSSEDECLLSGLLTMKEFEALVASVPGHEWLAK